MKPIEAPAGRLRAGVIPASERLSAYVNLTKPDVTFLVIMTTVAGFYAGSSGPLDWALLVHTVLGTTMVGAGTAALNHFAERESDRHMRRTASRPLPSGLIEPAHAFWFGAVLITVGTVYLGMFSTFL